MLKDDIYNSYESIKPDQNAKERMLENIQSLTVHQKFSGKGTKIMRISTKMLFRAASVLAVALVVTTVTYAAHLFGLRDVNIGKENIGKENVEKENIEERKVQNLPPEEKEVDIIALSGIMDSPEYKAAAEWWEFSENYDKDGAILFSIGNSPTGLDASYTEAYLCYTQEMADKLDELCAKYQLTKLTGFTFAENYDDLCAKADIGDFMGNTGADAKLSFIDAYLYSDGTFHLEGTAVIGGSSLCTTDFQLMRSMRGSLNTVLLNVGDINQYTQWDYVTRSGVTVHLSLSSYKALIIAEREKSFIVVNILGDILPDTFDIDKTTLESMADAFDFSVVP